MVVKRLCRVHVRFDWSVFSARLTLVKEGYLNSVSMVWCFYCFVRKMGVKCFFSWHFVRFFFFVTSSPTLLLMINRESFNRHQDWLERRPGQSQAQMRKEGGSGAGLPSPAKTREQMKKLCPERKALQLEDWWSRNNIPSREEEKKRTKAHLATRSSSRQAVRTQQQMTAAQKEAGAATMFTYRLSVVMYVGQHNC